MMFSQVILAWPLSCRLDCTMSNKARWTRQIHVGSQKFVFCGRSTAEYEHSSVCGRVLGSTIRVSAFCDNFGRKLQVSTLAGVATFGSKAQQKFGTHVTYSAISRLSCWNRPRRSRLKRGSLPRRPMLQNFLKCDVIDLLQTSRQDQCEHRICIALAKSNQVKAPFKQFQY